MLFCALGDVLRSAIISREIDAVVELPDSEWCAFEIKLGANQIDAAAQNLLNIKKLLRMIPKANHLLFCVFFAAWQMLLISDLMVFSLFLLRQ